MLKKVVLDERGRALVLALIVLGIGVLLIPIFLSHISTNLQATRITEDGIKLLYAADAGAEYALWKLLDNPDCSETCTYRIIVNNRTVVIEIKEAD